MKNNISQLGCKTHATTGPVARGTTALPDPPRRGLVVAGSSASLLQETAHDAAEDEGQHSENAALVVARQVGEDPCMAAAQQGHRHRHQTEPEQHPFLVRAQPPVVGVRFGLHAERRVVSGDVDSRRGRRRRRGSRRRPFEVAHGPTNSRCSCKVVRSADPTARPTQPALPRQRW
ncbi:MAG TPA: hypothetical protein VLK29_10490 [Luteimonas sp.]|nr:hypothetical protein [Luteimonas sp.]